MLLTDLNIYGKNKSVSTIRVTLVIFTPPKMLAWQQASGWLVANTSQLQVEDSTHITFRDDIIYYIGFL